jgi:hypothetical protein
VHLGHEGLAAVIEAVAATEMTLHESSSLLIEVESGEEASSECACVAHHLRRDEGREATDFILYGRYLDRFRRDEDAAWRFAARELRVLWSEKRSVRVG